MRNLAVLSTTISTLDGVINNSTTAQSRITATAIDPDAEALYAASEKVTWDEDSGEVEVEIYKLEQDKLISVALLNTTAYKWGDRKFGSGLPQEIVALHVLPETRKLGLFMRGGDIAMMDLDSEQPMIEVEGTVEPGILAASWNPDESALAIVTAEEKLLLMASTFDTLSEKPVRTSEFGQDAPINVGWGSKLTQFHGSLGKSAAQAPSTPIVGASPDDHGLPRISWRGDGAFFVVSLYSLENGLNRRTLRVYDREAVLQSTAEDVPGLEGVLSWRPSGNLIAGTQRFGGFEGAGVGREGRHDVVFFERNGLRHGEFGLWVGRDTKDGNFEAPGGGKWGYNVKELLWSSDSNILAVWIEHNEGDAVQLWTTGNYHWYLKQEVWAPEETNGAPGRFTSVAWHPETTTNLILTTSRSVMQRTYAWEIFSSPSAPPKDSGSVAVFDGPQILLTPFRTQNVPPPMSSAQLSLFIAGSDNDKKFGRARPWKVPIHAAFSNLDEMFVVLWESGEFAVFDLETRLGPGLKAVMNPQWKWGGNIWEVLDELRSEVNHEFAPRQVVLLDNWMDGWQQNVVILASGKEGDLVLVVAPNDKVEMFRRPGEESNIQLKSTGKPPGRNGRLVNSSGGVIAWQGPNGELLEFDPTSEQFLPVSKFDEFSSQAQRVLIDPDDAGLYIGLSTRNKLHITFQDSSRTIATNITSFTVASGFLIYTTSAHESIYAPLPSLLKLLAPSDDDLEQEKSKAVALPETEGWEKRRVERGSKIVVAVPSSMALVLQMPRGNLETINPRPLVMEVVKQDLDVGNYRKAFFACRKHRIDLNVIVDHNESKFLESVKDVVEQIHEVDHINLLLTSIGRGLGSPEKIARLCDALRGELERVDLVKYVNSVLTAYVVKTPPDLESALSVLHRLRETDPSVVEEAVKYVIFLADADKLVDVALGMYDFSLVLLIAQFAQKDPREYLPFLRELRALEKYYQRFRIDDYLKRYESALKNLSLAGDDRLGEAFIYVDKYQLHEAALKIWKNTPHYSRALELYGDWLFERRDFRQAAVAFVEANKFQKALVAHEKALEWQELFDLAAELETPSDDIEAMAYRVAEDLISKKRYRDAATVFLDYAQNIRQAVIALVEGNGFSEARRVVRMRSVPGLVEEIIHPAALESCSQIAEDLKEMQEQLRKQHERLKELRIRKVEEPEAFYNTEDPTLHNVDVMTDVSMAPTTFTRYTVAASATSRTSKRSSRSKRKLERKAGSGRKGTVDEEEYLLKSITKLVGRFIATRDLTRNLLPHLFRMTEEHRHEGLDLQRQIGEFENELRETLDGIWFRPEEENETWASRMEEIEKKRLVNPIERVTKPDFFVGKDWQIDLFSLS